MVAQEIVVCATHPSSSALGQGNISLHDINTGASLASFKQTSSDAHCTAVVETRLGMGGLLLAAQPYKALLNVYSFQKDQLLQKIVLPEKLSCLVVDSQGDYCAGGTSSGRIYLWELASGLLLNSFDAHYRRISVLRFTADGSALISGSEDSGISVWTMARLLDNQVQHEIPTSYCALSDHTLAITDIVCGTGMFPHSRVLTSSLDNSCKLWDLSTRSLLATFSFPHSISVLAMDPTERMFFAASTDGSVHQVNLFRRQKSKFAHQVGAMEAFGISDTGDADRMNINGATKERLISVRQPVSSMAFSMTSAHLIVGTSQGLIHIYDVSSHQLLRSITTHKGYSISFIASMSKPQDLFGHIPLGESSKEAIPVRPIIAFQRIREAKSREAHEVTLSLPVRTNGADNTHSSILAEHRFFMESTASADGAALQSRVSDLENEVSRLKDQLVKAKSLNDSMWESVVSTVMTSDQPASDGAAAEGRMKKRTRLAS